MEELEKKKKKRHDHLLTKLLKFGIFAVIMLAPFLSVASKCLYVAFNKNAKDSYYGETINQSQYVDVIRSNEFTFNDTYYFKLQKSHNYRFTNSQFIIENITDFNTEKTNIDTNAIQQNTSYFTLNNNAISFYTSDNTQIAGIDIYYYNTNFKVTIINGFYQDAFSYNSTLTKLVYNNYSFLDNTFEYAVNELNNNNLYNWSKQTAIYGAIQTMTSGLGANDVLAMLLAYWSILTAIYIVFDIIIELFTYLTHLISSD